jgi:hypothetical protein
MPAEREAGRKRVNEREHPMVDEEITAADLDALASFDTPTICNALEHLDKNLQGQGYTSSTVRLRLPAAEAHRRLRAHRNDSLGRAARSLRRRAIGTAQ